MSPRSWPVATRRVRGVTSWGPRRRCRGPAAEPRAARLRWLDRWSRRRVLLFAARSRLLDRAGPADVAARIAGRGAKTVDRHLAANHNPPSLPATDRTAPRVKRRVAL